MRHLLHKSTLLVGCVLLVIGVVGCQKGGEVRTQIKSFDGELNPDDGLVHADVYILVAPPSDRMDSPIEQNLIEVVTPRETMRFHWPDQFGAGWSEIVDLDSDGFREFVFVSGTVARVVSFRKGIFTFRPREDEFVGQHQIRMVDSDGDGRPELVSYAPRILDLKAPPGTISFLAWNSAAGFGR